MIEILGYTFWIEFVIYYVWLLWQPLTEDDIYHATEYYR